MRFSPLLSPHCSASFASSQPAVCWHKTCWTRPSKIIRVTIRARSAPFDRSLKAYQGHSGVPLVGGACGDVVGLVRAAQRDVARIQGRAGVFGGLFTDVTPIPAGSIPAMRPSTRRIAGIRVPVPSRS